MVFIVEFWLSQEYLLILFKKSSHGAWSGPLFLSLWYLDAMHTRQKRLLTLRYNQVEQVLREEIRDRLDACMCVYVYIGVAIDTGWS